MRKQRLRARYGTSGRAIEHGGPIGAAWEAGCRRDVDTFGHAAGDALLREFRRILREGLRRSDISCRYGGEEFALILPDSSLADTRQRIEQIRALVKELQIRHGEQLLATVTVSAGVTEARGHGSNTRELLRAAAEALYAAKQAGRDRIAVYETPG